jgi:hypothetical protein
VVAVQHRAPSGSHHLARLLAPYTALKVVSAAAPMTLAPGQVIRAPPGHHLELVSPWHARAERTDRVNYRCPAADVLFASVARHAGTRAIACALTGSGRDGVAGIRAVRAAGGFAIAQSPRCAEFPDMPRGDRDPQSRPRASAARHRVRALQPDRRPAARGLVRLRIPRLQSTTGATRRRPASLLRSTRRKARKAACGRARAARRACTRSPLPI